MYCQEYVLLRAYTIPYTLTHLLNQPHSKLPVPQTNNTHTHPLHTLCYTLINTDIKAINTHVTHKVTLVYFTVLYTIGVVGFVPFSWWWAWWCPKHVETPINTSYFLHLVGYLFTLMIKDARLSEIKNTIIVHYLILHLYQLLSQYNFSWRVIYEMHGEPAHFTNGSTCAPGRDATRPTWQPLPVNI
jgi:hypothetical protein